TRFTVARSARAPRLAISSSSTAYSTAPTRLSGWSNASGMRMMGLTASAAAGGPVRVAGPHELVEELPLCGQGQIRVAAAQVLEVRLVVRHPHHPARGPDQGEQLSPHTPSRRRGIPWPRGAAGW